MAWTLIAEREDAVGSNGTTTAINSSGADFFVVFQSYRIAEGPGISDSRGLTWTGSSVYSTDEVGLKLWYAKNATGGTGHTFTNTAANLGCLAVQAWSGSDLSAPYDVETGAYDFIASLATGSITPAGDNELWVSGFATYESGALSMSVTVGTLAGEAGNGGVYAVGHAYQVQTTGAARNATWSKSASYKETAIAIFFKAGSGGGGGGVIGRDRVTGQAVSRATNW